MAFIPPRYRVVAIDETSNWADSIIAQTGRIAGVYIVNFAEVTHLCSLTGAYWAEFVCNITENYIREPDGYNSGVPIWDQEFITDEPEAYARSVALLEAWGEKYYGLAYENGGEPGMYIERLAEPDGDLIDVVDAGWGEDPDETDDPDEYRSQRDKAAQEAVQEYMSNGVDWSDIAPWNRDRGGA